jgi:hypothetical protein
MPQLLEQVRHHKANIDCNDYIVMVTTLVLEVMRCFCIKRVIYINLVDILNSEIAIFSIGDIFITRNVLAFN